MSVYDKVYFIKENERKGRPPMKSTGIVRKVDELGRIVLPIEMRRTLDIAEKDALEIYVEGSSVILRKYKPSCCKQYTGEKLYSVHISKILSDLKMVTAE